MTDSDLTSEQREALDRMDAELRTLFPQGHILTVLVRKGKGKRAMNHARIRLQGRCDRILTALALTREAITEWITTVGGNPFTDISLNE